MGSASTVAQTEPENSCLGVEFPWHPIIRVVAHHPAVVAPLKSTCEILVARIGHGVHVKIGGFGEIWRIGVDEKRLLGVCVNGLQKSDGIAFVHHDAASEACNCVESSKKIMFVEAAVQ